MNFKFSIIVFAMSCVISGCGTIGSKTISDDTFARKAAFALGTTPDKVTISNKRSRGLTEVDFTATTRGKDFQCYIAAGIYGTSDAICTGLDGSMDGVRCDELSRAAGRCN